MWVGAASRVQEMVLVLGKLGKVLLVDVLGQTHLQNVFVQFYPHVLDAVPTSMCGHSI